MHKRLTLPDADDEGGCNWRPDLSVWTETPAECEGAKGVVLGIGPSHGGQQRFIELKPAEARTLAALLAEAAGIAEKQVEVAL